AELEERVARLAARAARADVRPSVLTIEWLDPVMVGGLWMPELVTLAGGRALVTEPGQPAPTLTRAELAELEPDIVLVKPCGFELARTAGERAFVADGNAYFNRSGPRLVESLEILAACVQPERFPELVRAHAGSVRRV